MHLVWGGQEHIRVGFEPDPRPPGGGGTSAARYTSKRHRGGFMFGGGVEGPNGSKSLGP